VFLLATPAGAPDNAAAIRAGLVAGLLAVVGRGLMRFAWRRITPPERAVIVGSGSLAEATGRKLEVFPDIHVELARPDPTVVNDIPRLTEELVDLGIDRVIIATEVIDEHALVDLVTLCRREHVKLSVVAPLRGSFGTAVRLSRVADLPLIEYNTWDVSRSTLLLKRAMDLAVSSVVLVATAPLWLLIATLIVIDTRGPVFFAQTRVGQAGRPFRMLKFRTMVSNAEQLLDELVPFDQLREPMFKLARDPRVTRVGRVLRRTSLDELPQLVNVLRGDMSLVGPRPEQVELVERYTEEQLLRLAVKPGLTGPMQVYGRGQLRFEERLAVEREYIENLSIGRDLRILAMTVAPVISGRGAF
jgi:exopolysaccharide biosynthesis polyprenyl glycosylphosphotransferase